MEALQKEGQTAPWGPGDPSFTVWGSHQRRRYTKSFVFSQLRKTLGRWRWCANAAKLQSVMTSLAKDRGVAAMSRCCEGMSRFQPRENRTAGWCWLTSSEEGSRQTSANDDLWMWNFDGNNQTFLWMLRDAGHELTLHRAQNENLKIPMGSWKIMAEEHPRTFHFGFRRALHVHTWFHSHCISGLT